MFSGFPHGQHGCFFHIDNTCLGEKSHLIEYQTEYNMVVLYWRHSHLTCIITS